MWIFASNVVQISKHILVLEALIQLTWNRNPCALFQIWVLLTTTYMRKPKGIVEVFPIADKHRSQDCCKLWLYGGRCVAAKLKWAVASVEISVYLCVSSIIVFFFHSLEQTVLQASLFYLLFTVFFFISCYCIYSPFRLLVNPRSMEKKFHPV